MSYLSVARGLGVAGSAAPAQATRGTSVGAAAPPRRARLSLRASSETEAATRTLPPLCVSTK